MDYHKRDVGLTRTFEVARIGHAAAGLLSRCDAVEVLAVFRRSFYIADPDGGSGGVACLLGKANQPGPLHALCHEWPEDARETVPVGALLRRDGGRLSAPGFAIEWTRAREWRPPPYPPRADWNRQRGWQGLMELLPTLAPSDSLLAQMFLGQTRASGDPMTQALAAETEKGLAAVSRWLEAPSASTLAAVWSLLGLGPGLTPSGDDILAGVILALYAIEWNPRARELFATSLRDQAGKTNRIGMAHLAAAAAGEGAAAFHDCLSALLAGADPGPSLDAISRIGHSSGWDALLGILWVMRHFH